MKSFKFTLARMRDYKEQVLDKEKGTLRLLNQQLDEILDKIAALEQYQAAKHQEFMAKQQEGQTGECVPSLGRQSGKGAQEPSNSCCRGFFAPNDPASPSMPYCL